MSDNQNVQSSLEPFEDRIDILFRELELAVKWQRPSILLVVYGSDYIRSDAVKSLENRLAAIGQNVLHFNFRGAEHFDVPSQLSKTTVREDSIFFVSGLGGVSGTSSANAYTSLNRGRDFFVDHKVRIVIWLTENEAINLAHYAPDYWAFRHRVIEFTESPKPEQILTHALEWAWQGIGEYTNTLQDTDAQIMLREAMLDDLPDQDEVTAIRANLLLTLGILHWRKGEFEKADKLLQTAYQAAAKMQDNWFRAECSNALALVKSDMGLVEEAIDAYKQATRLAPDQIFPWNNLGNLYIKLDRFDEAFSAFEKAIENNSCDAVSWNGMGNLYRKLNRDDDAIAAYHKAIEYSSNFANPWNGIGDVLSESGQFEDAVHVYQRALEINDQYVAAWVGLGKTLVQLKQHGNAAEAYHRALKVDAQQGPVWHELGRICYKLGDFDLAKQAYEQALQLDPTSGWLHGDLGQLYARLEDNRQALSLLLKSLDLLTDPKDQAAIWNRLGNLYRQINEYEEAISAYQKADELDGGDSASDDNWIEIEMREEGGSQVDDEFARWLESLDGVQQPELVSQLVVETIVSDQTVDEVVAEVVDQLESPESVQSLAEPEATVEAENVPAEDTVEVPEPAAVEPEPVAELAEAESESEVEIELVETKAEPAPEIAADAKTLPYRGAADLMEVGTDSKNAHIWNELGNIYFTAGAYEQAVKAFKNAIQLDDNYGWPYGNLGLTYAHQGHYEEAIPLYRLSLELLSSEKDQAVIWNRLGNAYRRLNDYENAAKAYRMADGLGPNQASLVTRARFSLLSNCYVE